MQHSAYSCSRNAALRVYLYAYLGPIAELVRGQVHLAKGAFSNQATEGIVADGPELVGRELAARGQPLRVEADRKRRDGTHSNSCWYELASWAWRRALARLVVSRALLLVVVAPLRLLLEVEVCQLLR